MLIACTECERQYSCERAKAGENLVCVCGATVSVSEKPSHAPRPLKCSSCAGPLRARARDCEYCGCQITLEERRLSEICPKCCARMSEDAKYCMECGLSIEPQILSSLPKSKLCPRCKGDLRVRVITSASVVECSLCAGLWMQPECFQRLCDKAEEIPESALVTTPEVDRLATSLNKRVQYLPCPECRDLMVRRNFGTNSGIIIDLCRHHGVWLDHQELEKILRFVREGGLVSARRMEVLHLERDARRAREQRDFGSFADASALSGSSSWDTDVGTVVSLLGRTVLRWLKD